MPDATRPVTDDERETFEAIRDPNFSNFALMSVLFDGEPTAAIIAVSDDGNGAVDTWPVAILTTDAMFARLTPPEGVEEVDNK